jgi:hypothetical protein
LASLGILLIGVAAIAQQPAAQPKDAKEKKTDQASQPGNLDDLITQALRNNPDIRVAEAKVREAEAELNRTRMSVAQKVVALFHSIDIARKMQNSAKQDFDTVTRLRGQGGGGAVSVEDFRKAKLAWESAIAQVAKLEAEMPALLGKLPGKLGEDKKAEAGSDATPQAIQWLLQRSAIESSEEEFAHVLTRAALTSVHLKDTAPKGTMAERIRKAMDTPINGDYKGKPFDEVLKDFEKRFDGIAFRIVQTPPKGQMDINLGQVPLGSAIQAVNDILAEYRFVVRDYGILFTHKDWLPPGALLLHDFWKSDAGKEKLKGERSDGSDARNPPPAEVKGSVKAVDSASGLLTVTIGSDAGLAKGHTLEIYRLGTVKTGPKYVGTIRILDVRPNEAVAKPVGRLHDAIQTGDSVASKITDK